MTDFIPPDFGNSFAAVGRSLGSQTEPTLLYASISPIAHSHPSTFSRHLYISFRLFQTLSDQSRTRPSRSDAIMSFLGGPECSTAANPLAQFTKHTQDDKSLQRDRLIGRGLGGMGESMRTQPMGAPQDAVCGIRRGGLRCMRGAIGFTIYGPVVDTRIMGLICHR